MTHDSSPAQGRCWPGGRIDLPWHMTPDQPRVDADPGGRSSVGRLALSPSQGQQWWERAGPARPRFPRLSPWWSWGRHTPPPQSWSAVNKHQPMYCVYTLWTNRKEITRNTNIHFVMCDSILSWFIRALMCDSTPSWFVRVLMGGLMCYLGDGRLLPGVREVDVFVLVVLHSRLGDQIELSFFESSLWGRRGGKTRKHWSCFSNM